MIVILKYCHKELNTIEKVSLGPDNFDYYIEYPLYPMTLYRGPLQIDSDFVMAYSVIPGQYSWRNRKRGSWFIESLDACLEKYASSKDLLSILTRVNKKVAIEYESNTSVK